MKRIAFVLLFIVLNIMVLPAEAKPQDDNPIVCYGIAGLTSDGEPLIYDYELRQGESVTVYAYNHPTQVSLTRVSNNQVVASTNGYSDPAELSYTVSHKKLMDYQLKIEFQESSEPIYPEITLEVCRTLYIDIAT